MTAKVSTLQELEFNFHKVQENLWSYHLCWYYSGRFWYWQWFLGDQILPIRKADVQHELATFIRAVSMSFNCGFPYKQVVTFRMSDAPLNPGRRYFLIVRSCFRSLFAAKNLHLIWSAQFGAVFSAWWLIMRLGCWWVPAQSPYQRLLRGYWVCCSYFKATC